MRLSELVFGERDLALLATIALAGHRGRGAGAAVGAAGARPAGASVVLPAMLAIVVAVLVPDGAPPAAGAGAGRLPLFAIALADPATPAVAPRSDPRRAGASALMIDGSSSMLAPFAARTLTTKDAPMEATFFTSVAAAERFVRLRMDGGYRDLLALIEFADTAYVITPFTTDYDNILLSLSLIGNMGEWENFPDRGTVIAQAVEQAVSLFRAFDFLDASGNLMVIFSDGEDAEVTESGRNIDDVLSDAVKAKVPVYFVRISKGNTKLPDALWQRGDQPRPAAASTPPWTRRRCCAPSARSIGSRPARSRRGSTAPACRASRLTRWRRWRCGCWRAALRLLAPQFRTFP